MQHGRFKAHFSRYIYFQISKRGHKFFFSSAALQPIPTRHAKCRPRLVQSLPPELPWRPGVCPLEPSPASASVGALLSW